MSVFDRLETLLRSEWNGRRPGQRFGDELVDDLQQARIAMRRLSSDEQMLERRIQQSRSEVQYRQAQAARAVQQGDEPRARNELRQRIHEEQRLESMERDWHEMRRRIDSIQDTLRLAEQHAGVAPYDRREFEPPAPSAAPSANAGSSYYRALGPSDRHKARAQASNTDERTAPRADRDLGLERRRSRGGDTSNFGSARPFSADVSSDPFERFDDMEASMNHDLSSTEAESELSLDISTDDFTWDDDPLADPLEATFSELESEESLKRLKESSGDPGSSNSDDPLTRLKDRLQRDDES